MTIDAISGGGTKSYETMEVSAPISRPDFQTAEPAQVQTEARDSSGNSDNGYSEENLKNGNPPSENTVKQAVSDINKRINSDTVAEFGYHEKTHRVTIKLVDKKTDETIREFPAEETLDMIAKVWELAGMFVDERR